MCQNHEMLPRVLTLSKNTNLSILKGIRRPQFAGINKREETFPRKSGCNLTAEHFAIFQISDVIKFADEAQTVKDRRRRRTGPWKINCNVFPSASFLFRTVFISMFLRVIRIGRLCHFYLLSSNWHQKFWMQGSSIQTLSLQLGFCEWQLFRPGDGNLLVISRKIVKNVCTLMCCVRLLVVFRTRSKVFSNPSSYNRCRVRKQLIPTNIILASAWVLSVDYSKDNPYDSLSYKETTQWLTRLQWLPQSVARWSPYLFPCIFNNASYCIYSVFYGFTFFKLVHFMWAQDQFKSHFPACAAILGLLP